MGWEVISNPRTSRQVTVSQQQTLQIPYLESRLLCRLNESVSESVYHRSHPSFPSPQPLFLCTPLPCIPWTNPKVPQLDSWLPTLPLSPLNQIHFPQNCHSELSKCKFEELQDQVMVRMWWNRYLIFYWWDCNIAIILMISNLAIPIKIKNTITFDLCIPTFGTLFHRNKSTHM